jgi:predicted transcriptional regulator
MDGAKKTHREHRRDRIELGVKQCDLAEVSRIGASRLCRYETGRARLTEVQLQRLERALARASARVIACAEKRTGKCIDQTGGTAV